VAVQTISAFPVASQGFHIAFVVARFFCLLFYFTQYAIRSSPGVMIPELTAAFGLSALGVSSLLGIYYYTYSTFAIIAGASLDRWSAKYTIPIGVKSSRGAAPPALRRGRARAPRAA
jgi:fucose permease